MGGADGEVESTMKKFQETSAWVHFVYCWCWRWCLSGYEHRTRQHQHQHQHQGRRALSGRLLILVM